MSQLSCIVSVLFVAATAAALDGCSTTIATKAPREVDLSGEWQIDLPLSDFPQEAVPVQSPVIDPSSPGSSGSGQGGGRGHGGGGGGGGGRGHGGGGGGGMGSPMAGGPGGVGRNGSPEHHFAMPPHLSITQSATGITVDITMPDGKHVTNAYTAGEKTVVTTTRGAANRTLGWEGEAFLIRTQVGDKGPESEVRYLLDNDGTLAVTSTISHSGIYDFQYTLEYDRVRP